MGYSSDMTREGEIRQVKLLAESEAREAIF